MTEIKVVVTTDDSVMFSERVNPDHFESDHFRVQLVERLAWAVGDAHAVEQSRANSNRFNFYSRHQRPTIHPHKALDALLQDLADWSVR